MYQTIAGGDLRLETQKALLTHMHENELNDLRYVSVQGSYGLKVDIKRHLAFLSDKNGEPKQEPDGSIKQYDGLSVTVSGVDLDADPRYSTDNPAKALQEFQHHAKELGYTGHTPELEVPVAEVVTRSIEQEKRKAPSILSRKVMRGMDDLPGNLKGAFADITPNVEGFRSIYSIEERGNGLARVHTVSAGTGNNHHFAVHWHDQGINQALLDPETGEIVEKDLRPELHAHLSRNYEENDLAQAITFKAEQALEIEGARPSPGNSGAQKDLQEREGDGRGY